MIDRGRLVRTVAVGAVVAVAYVALAALTAHFDPLERRPVLDGLAPPPPYRWVSPPPALAASNQPAEGAQLDVPITGGQTTVGVFLTPDSQAAVLLQQGAVPLPAGTTKVTIRLQPLAPPTAPALPQGGTIVGNVYRIDLVIDGNAPSTHLLSAAQVAIVYPAEAGPHRPHTMVISQDDKTFSALPSSDNSIGQQVIAQTTSLGYLAVSVGGSPATSGAAPPSGSGPPVAAVSPAVSVSAPGPASPLSAEGRSLLPLLLVAIPIALFVLFVIVEVLIHRRGPRRL